MTTKRNRSLTAAGALVLGVVSFPPPALAADLSNCLTHWHTVGITTQTEYVRNDCASGTFGFQVHSWSRISSETSRCISVAPGRQDGWKWTRGRSNFEVLGC